LNQDRDALLAFYDFRAEHWKHLRTTNSIESTFATVRHRTIRSKGCLSNRTALAMVLKLLEGAQKSWRRLDGHNQSPKLVLGVTFDEGIEVIAKPTDRLPIPPPPDRPGRHQNLAIAPSWVLGVEFLFYLVAPFMVRRSASLVATVLFASLALRLFPQFRWALQDDPWSYRFFPSELALFLVGVLGYRVYRAPQGAVGRRAILPFGAACLCMALALLINHWHGRSFSRIPAIILLWSIVLAKPLLFRISKTNVLDRALGELSYPTYISHFSVIWIFEHLFAMHDGAVRGLLSNAITLSGGGAVLSG
jgi:hypothetical protein